MSSKGLMTSTSVSKYIPPYCDRTKSLAISETKAYFFAAYAFFVYSYLLISKFCSSHSIIS